MVVDTNILLYLIKGDRKLQSYLESKQIYVSFITELELLSFKHLTEKEEALISYMLEMSTVIELNPGIKDQVIRLRKTHNLKLPDAIIAATSVYLDIPLLTADKSFKSKAGIDVIIYEIS